MFLPAAGGGEGRAYIVVLEGVEEVSAQLAIIPRGAWRIANATYVVRRILQKERTQ